MITKLILAAAAGFLAAVLAMIFNAPTWVAAFGGVTWFLVLDGHYGSPTRGL